MATETEDFKLNGVTVNKAFEELLKVYRLQQEKSDTEVPKDHPVLVRQRRITDNVQSLEGIVKGVLGNNVKADKAKADAIIHKLGYELAKAEGYDGKSEDISGEKLRTYFTNAASAIGSQIIGNNSEFTKSIMNMAAAKPGDALYEANSALAQLIQYIATQKDTESRRINYINSLVAEKWTEPETGIKLQGKVNTSFGIPLNTTATASDAIGEINRVAQLEAQQYAARTGKTYLKTISN